MSIASPRVFYCLLEKTNFIHFLELQCSLFLIKNTHRFCYRAVFKRDYAHCLGDFLYGKNPEYFYGVDEAIDLDKALLKSSEKEGRCLSEEERYEYLPITKKLLIPILRLAAIPDVQLENKEIENLDELERKFPSIYLYLEHSSKYKFTRDLKTGGPKIIEKNN